VLARRAGGGEVGVTVAAAGRRRLSVAAWCVGPSPVSRFLGSWGGLAGSHLMHLGIARPSAMCDKAAEFAATQDSLAAALVTQRSRGDLVESSLRLLVDVGGEADAAALRSRRVHQFADGRENGGDRLVMVLKLAFEFVELAGQGGVRGQ